MKTSILILSTLAMMAITPLASAQEYSLHFSGGASEVLHAPLDQPQQVFTKNQFKLGMSEEGSLLVNLVPNLAVGPVVAVEYLPQNALNSEASVLWNMGLAARLQGNRRTASVSPYLQAAGFVSKQAEIYNPGMSASAGIEWALEPTNSLWFGPFISWSHTFDSHATPAWQTLALDHHDLNVATAGFSISWDGPVHPRTVVETTSVQVPVVQERVVTVSVPVVQTVPTPAPLQLNQNIRFAQDSDALTPETKTTLDQVAATLNAHPTYSVVVNGSASSEGDDQHNLVLASQRAAAVVDYLVTYGNVVRSHLTAVSAGEVGAPNDQNNRQVNFFVLNCGN